MRFFAASVLAGFVFASAIGAQGSVCFAFDDVLHAGAPSEFARFGETLDFDGTRVVVGSGNGGPVTVFVREPSGSGFVVEAVLNSPEPQAGAGFGTALSVSGTTLVVGAPAFDGVGADSGRAYVFEFSSTWSHTQTLQSDDAEAGDLFGFSCSIEAGLLVVGAPTEDSAAFSGGAVYSFTCCTPDWAQDDKLVAPDARFLGRFGSSLDLESNTLIVGADLDSASGFAAGAAYMFERVGTTWLSEGRLSGLAPTAFDRAGTSVAVFGDHALVGVPGHDGSRGSGDVYEFGGGVWSPVSKLALASALPGTRFGASTSLSATHAALGGPADGLSERGSVLIAGNTLTGLSLRGEIVPAPFTEPASLGAAVALFGNVLVTGAPDASGPNASPAASAGSVTIARLGRTAFSIGAGTAGAGAFVPSLEASGCVGVETPWSLEVQSGAGGAPGFLLVGRTEINAPILGISFLVGGPLWLIKPHVLDGDQPGTGSIVMGFEWPVPPMVIELVAQALYIDASAPQGWSATQGVRLQLP